MKITKEKVLYFLSLNLIPLIFWFTLYVFGIWFEGDKGTVFYHIKNTIIEFILNILIPIFSASILVFIYSWKESLNYNIFVSALFSLIPLFVLILYIFFAEFLGDYFQNGFVLGSFAVLLFGYLFSLIILKITDPLRKKIVW